MKHPSTIRRYIRRLETRRGCDGGRTREVAAIDAMIGTLRWVLVAGQDGRLVFDPISHAMDAMIEDEQEKHPERFA